MTKKQDIQELKVGGGATGVSEVPAPVAKKATLPASNLNNGEPMPKIKDVTPGQYECETDDENNAKPEGNAAANKASIAAKPSAACSSMKEDMDALFNGEELTEDFKTKATTIFEAAVNARVEQLAEQIAIDNKAEMLQQITEIHEALAEGIDEYMNYVVEQWMDENQVAIERSLRTEVTEGFLSGLKKLFVENYFDIPEDKIDVAEELAARVQELETRLNESIEQNLELNNTVVEFKKDKLFAEVTEGLAATQVEKLRSLAEGIEYSDAETYGKKLQIVKESYFKDDKKSEPVSQILNEEIVTINEEGEVKPVDPAMAKYVTAISRTLKN